MKILYLLHSFPPFHWRGTEVYALELAQAMSQTHEVRVFYLRHDSTATGVTIENDVFENLPVHRARLRIDPARPNTYFFNPSLEAAFLEVMNRFQPEVVHFLYYTGGLSLTFPLLAVQKGGRLVITATDFSGFCPRGQLLDGKGGSCPGPRQALRCVPCLFDKPVIAASPALDRFLREHWPARWVRDNQRPELALLRRRLAVIREAFQAAAVVIFPNANARRRHHAAGLIVPGEKVLDYGIDTKKYAEHRKTAADHFRIGFVGQLLPHKGLHLLAAAIRGLEGNFRLRIHGSLEDAGAREYYQSLHLESDRTDFCGVFPFSEMNRVLEQIDILVVPSTWEENCPLIVKYALATGTSAVLADQPGMVPRREGLFRVRFFPPGDVSALREALRRSMADLSAEKKGGGPERLPLAEVLRRGAITDIRDQARELEKIYVQPGFWEKAR